MATYIQVYDRAVGILREEKQYGEKSLEFLYHTVPGRILLQLFFCRRIYSRLNGMWMKSPLSKGKIEPFIREYGIDLSGCERQESADFKSFDDFFTRRYHWQCKAGVGELMAPCQGRLLCCRVEKGLALPVKGSVYTLPELVDNRFELARYEGGVCLVYRLAPQDCHRYYFCDRGRILRTEEIKGVLHTVRPLSERYRVFSRNHRICTLMRTERFGEVLQIEVGALQIGRIHNLPVTEFARMDEKGYFSYGGSTILQLFWPGVISVDADIQEYSGQGVEVLVTPGERIAAC